MGDRAYTRFSIPMSVLVNGAMTDAVRSAFGISLSDFQHVVLSDPTPDEANGHDSFAVRLIDGHIFLVYENENCNYGGSDIESILCAAHVPFIQANAAGDEYGPTSTVFDGDSSEVIRLDHDLKPIAGIDLVDGCVVADPGEMRDFQHYHQLRNAVLLYPALTA